MVTRLPQGNSNGKPNCLGAFLLLVAVLGALGALGGYVVMHG
jgi:hypothetical protein